MLEPELRARRDAVIADFGPWIGYNIDLGSGVYTMAPGVAGMAEDRVKRIVQLVTDFAGRPVSQLRILDLGAHECGFAIELARRGANVVAIEPRKGHLAKATFVKEALELDHLTIVEGNARDVAALTSGSFDVVLCLGLLYHLDAEGACALLHDLRPMTKSFAIVETQVGLTGPASFTHDGHTYLGRPSPERTRSPGAAVDITSSFWLTKPSLLNLLADAGFSSVVECLNPVIPELAAFRDHVTFIAAAGEPIEYLGRPVRRWPERLASFASPSQGLRWAMLERLRRHRGMASVFTKRQG